MHNAKQERRHDDGDDLVPTLRKEVQDHAAKDHFLYESGGDASERDPGAEGAEHLAAAHIRAHKCAAKEQQIAAGHSQRQEHRRDCPAGLNVQLRHPECGRMLVQHLFAQQPQRSVGKTYIQDAGDDVADTGRELDHGEQTGCSLRNQLRQDEQ